MKIYIVIVGILLAAVTLTSNTLTYDNNVNTTIVRSQPTAVENFMARVARIESGGKHTVVNEFGMMGKYQFAPSTVRSLGFRITQREFLKNPRLQDSVMLAYMKENSRYLRRYIAKYDGEIFKGIKITKAGILAGAHFAGSGSVEKYFQSADEDGPSDARGTTLKFYMKQFSEVHLPRGL